MSTEASVQDVIEEWRAELDALYDQVETWLSELSPPPQVERRTIQLHEGLSGIYDAEELVIRSHGEEVRLTPVARWSVATDGLVELTGIDSPTIFAIIHDRGGWLYVPDWPERELVPLDGPLFRKLLMANLE